MQSNCSLFDSELGVDSTMTESISSFSVEELNWMSENKTDEQTYEQVVFEVFRKPKHLLSHVQRIYFTYTHNMAEQLYAAVVDLVWVLDGKGKALRNRMLAVSRKFFTESQAEMFNSYLNQQNIHYLSGNKYSIFATCLVGTNQLIQQQATENIIHDPLTIARDYIEYSQLDEAIEILESAILDTPKRLELQDELLGLYKVTKNEEAFRTMHGALQLKGIELPKGWQELSEHFTG